MQQNRAEIGCKAAKLAKQEVLQLQCCNAATHELSVIKTLMDGGRASYQPFQVP